MIRRVQEHDQLNGSAFAALEFLLIAAAASFVAISEGRQGSLVNAGLLAGIAVNCLVVVGFAAVARMHAHPGTGLLKLLDRDFRSQLAEEHPALMVSTVLITLTVLIPLCLTTMVAIEASRQA